MKIYFAGSIRGGRDDADRYYDIINHLKKYGDVLTEHVGNDALTCSGENTFITSIPILSKLSTKCVFFIIEKL